MIDIASSFIESAAFQNGLWLFLGVVAGALIQYALNQLTLKKQAKVAFRVLQIEIVHNLQQTREFFDKLAWLKERISSGQIGSEELFVAMHKFDYSSVQPLVSSGHFHILLGPERIGHYLDFHHFFRVENASFLSDLLKQEHERGKSLDCIDWMEGRAREICTSLETIKDSKIKRGKLKPSGNRGAGKLSA